MSQFILLDESGDGEPYSHPGKKGRFFKLPYAYWRDGWSEKLALPSKFVLLIALSCQKSFTLPLSKAPDWYGISSDTAARGLEELIEKRLLRCQRTRKKAPLAPKGFSYDRHFSLIPPFDRDRIAKLGRKKR